MHTYSDQELIFNDMVEDGLESAPASLLAVLGVTTLVILVGAALGLLAFV